VSVDRSFLTAEVARARVAADIEAIDAALGRLRETSTDLVGNAFRVEVAERLEIQQRVNRGLSYRLFGEVADPPDGVDDPAMPAGVKVRDKLHFACGPDHAMVTDGHATTTVTSDGRLAWSIGGDPPDVNHIHHDHELLDDDPPPEAGC
jgi:hypothetical protein